jgi:VWFA-related protein
MRSFHLQRWVKINIDNREGQIRVVLCYSVHGRKAMQRLAEETGGAFFQVTGDQPIEKIYTQIEDALRNQYSIGYTPQRTNANGSYRKIKLTAVRPGLMVRTRDGYYPK